MKLLYFKHPAHRRFFLISLIGFSMIFSFQNCSPGFEISSSNQMGAMSLSSVDNSDLKLGTDLYNKKCSQCHGQLQLTGKAGSSVQLITAAIGTVPQMAIFSGLSSREIELISIALKGPPQVVTVGTKTMFACNTKDTRISSILKLSNREFSVALSTILNDFSVSPTSPLSNDTEFSLLVNANVDVSAGNAFIRF